MKIWGFVIKKDGKWLVLYYVKRNNLIKFCDVCLFLIFSCMVIMFLLKVFLLVYVYVFLWIDWVNLIVSILFLFFVFLGRVLYMLWVYFS